MLPKILFIVVLASIVTCEEFSGASFSISIKHDPPKKHHSSHNSHLSQESSNHSFKENLGLSFHTGFGHSKEPAQTYKKQTDEKNYQNFHKLSGSQQTLSSHHETDDRQDKNHHFNQASEQVSFNLGGTSSPHESENNKADNHKHSISSKNVVKHVSASKKHQVGSQESNHHYSAKHHEESFEHGYPFSSQSSQYVNKSSHGFDFHEKSVGSQSHGSEQSNGHAYSFQSFILHSGHDNKEENKHESAHHTFEKSSSSNEQDNRHKSNSHQANSEEQSKAFGNYFSKYENKKQTSEDILSHVLKNSQDSYHHSNGESSSSFGFRDLDASNHENSNLHHEHSFALGSYHPSTSNSETRHESSKQLHSFDEHDHKLSFGSSHDKDTFEHSQGLSSENLGLHNFVSQYEAVLEHKQDSGEHKQSDFTKNSGYKFETHHASSGHHGVSPQSSDQKHHRKSHQDQHSHGSLDNSKDYHHVSGNEDNTSDHGNTFTSGSSGYHYSAPQYETHHLLSSQEGSSSGDSQESTSDFSGYDYPIPQKEFHYKSSEQEKVSTEQNQGTEHKHEYETHHIITSHGGDSTHGSKYSGYQQHDSQPKPHLKSFKHEQISNDHISGFPKKSETMTSKNSGYHYESPQYVTHHVSSGQEESSSNQGHKYSFESARQEEKASQLGHEFTSGSLGYHYQVPQHQFHDGSSGLEEHGHGHSYSPQSVGHNSERHHQIEHHAVSQQDGYHENSHSEHHYF